MGSSSSYLFHMEALWDLAAVIYFTWRLWGSRSSYVFHMGALGGLAAVMYIIWRLWEIVQQLNISYWDSEIWQQLCLSYQGSWRPSSSYFFSLSGWSTNSYSFHMETLGDLAADTCFIWGLWVFYQQLCTLQNKCQATDPDRHNWGWSSRLSFFTIYKFWQNCASVRQGSDLILKTDYVYHMDALGDLAAVMYMIWRLWEILQQLCIWYGVSAWSRSIYAYNLEALKDLAAVMCIIWRQASIPMSECTRLTED